MSSKIFKKEQKYAMRLLTIPPCRVFKGGTFVFEVIGGRFEVYRTLVARKSKVLEAMMEIGMQESQDGVAPLKSTNSMTFARFAEFIMTGDYSPAKPVEPPVVHPPSGPGSIQSSDQEMEEKDRVAHLVLEPTQAVEELEEEAAEDSWGGRAFSLPRKERKKNGKKKYVSEKSRKGHTWGEFGDLFEWATPPPKNHDDLASPTTDVVIAPTLPTNSMFVPSGDWGLDYLPTFLSHAQLYVFADKYDVRDLQRLTARRLDEALALFEFQTPLATNFTSLLRYVYEHTPERDGKVDVLRTIVLNFTAKHIESLINSESFDAMIEDGGALVRDIVRKTVSRLEIANAHSD
jgi:hypothetical protein